MWKVLFRSVVGPAHVRAGQPCQDSCLVRLAPTAAGPVLLLACADGAGSVPFADEGARLACRSVVRMARDDLRDGLAVSAIDRDTVLSWHVRLLRELEEQARRRDATARDFACTLLLAVVGEHAAAFSQVGDGAIVTAAGEDYRTVFWPQTGEYANTTFFVTDPELAERLAFEQRPGRVDELALLSDGLQTMALNFAERGAHRPFFLPMFRKLREARPGDGLPAALHRFLDSPAVNQRSDDDKTLLLATRVPSRAPDTQTP
jgi:Protein phosphatase 2C